MTDATSTDPRRIAALENLLHHYLTDDRLTAGRELAVSVSDQNGCKVSFVSPPTKSEIDTLAKHLSLMREVVPDERNRVTLDVVNAALESAGIPPIKKTAQ